MNCRFCCAQIEEMGKREMLSSEARAHVDSCAKCRGFYQEQIGLRNLIGELATVSAPADFDLRLRARLAAKRNEEATSLPLYELWRRFAPRGFHLSPSAISFAFVAILLCAIGASVIFKRTTVDRSTVASFNTNDAQKTAAPSARGQSSEFSEAESPESAPILNGSHRTLVASKIHQRDLTRNETRRTRRIEIAGVEKNLAHVTSEGNLILARANAATNSLPAAPHERNTLMFSAVGDSPRLIGDASASSSNPKTGGAPSVAATKSDVNQTSANETLAAALGLEGRMLDASTKVAGGMSGSFLITKILPASPAARSDLRAGDIIETFDGISAWQVLLSAQKTTANDSARAYSLHVIRNGKPLELTLNMAAK